MKVVGSLFVRSGIEGDFSWMIDQQKYANALFVFNDNRQQYEEHRDHPDSSGGCAAGGGNAIIRPYQCKNPPRASGIPTGPGFTSLTGEIKALIDEAVARIAIIANEAGYEAIIYSAADDTGLLGHGIFNVPEDVRRYISSELKKLETPS